MDSFELNKIIGAILGTLLFVMGVGFLAEGIYAPIVTQQSSYDLPEPAANASTTAAAAPSVPLPELLAKADPQAGADSAKKCQSCHDFTEGGPNKTGPNLYNIVGQKIADVPGYSFSDALKAHASETWTYDNLNKWLTSPKAFAPGTKMTFVGIPDDSERANVIAYLRSLSHNPVPLPAATAAAAPAGQPGAPAANAPAAPAANAPAAPAANAPAANAPAAAAPATPAGTTPATAGATPAPAATPSAGTGTTNTAPNTPANGTTAN
jgi:cytochrome c